jgi:hypothetical protein
VYYYVHAGSGHRDPKKRLSFELLIQLSARASKGADKRLATDAAKSVVRGSFNLRTQWAIRLALFESPEIPRTTPKVAANGCLVWNLKNP